MTAVVEIDVTDVPRRTPVAAESALVLVRVAHRVAGTVRVRADGGSLSGDAILTAVARDDGLADRVARLASEVALTGSVPPRLPACTVAVCTRGRAVSLVTTLESVLRAVPPGGEVLVVDNDPPDDDARRAVADLPVRYVVERERGLNRARVRALVEATGDVVLFTDDDARVDRAWIAELTAPFAVSRVAAVCGLIMPSSLDSDASEWFERLGGMGRGFEPAIFDAVSMPAADAGMLGAGANLAVRRDVALDLDVFVPTLDRGTAARCGGDSYALYRVLAAGYRVAYAPDALVWHDHRATWDGLRETLHDHNAGGAAMLARCLVDDRDPEALVVALRRLWRDHVRPLGATVAGRPDAAPLDLRLSALRGWATGVAAYARTRNEP